MWTGLFLSGAVHNPDCLRRLGASCGRLWAIDGGLDRMLALGLETQHVLGDGDSLSEEGMQYLKAHQLEFERFPEKKDQTDSELAVLRIMKCIDSDPSKKPETAFPLPADKGLMMLAALGARVDHVLANLDLAERYARSDYPFLISDGNTLIWTVKGPFRMSLHWPEVSAGAAHGDCYFSLLAVSDTVCGLDIRNAKWELQRVTLERGINLGVSNEPLAGKTPELAFEKGCLRIILSRESKEESRHTSGLSVKRLISI